MTRYSHALTVAFEVESSDPRMPTLEEALEALRRRYLTLATNPHEAEDALMGELPFDTYEIAEDEAPAGTGALGLPFGEVGGVVQAIAECLVDRGHDRDKIVARLRDIDLTWWEAHGSDAVDSLAHFIDIPADPEQSEKEA